MAHHQIRKLKNRNENLSRDLNYALDDLDDANNEIRSLEIENENLEWRIRSLQIQLNESQEQIAEKELLLREKDETLAEYLAQINEMDNDLNSGQDSSKNPACPLCFQDVRTKTSEQSTSWVEIEPCGHRTCWECYMTTARDKFTADMFKDYPLPFRYEPVCGICDEPAKNALVDDGVERVPIYCRHLYLEP